MPPPDRPTTRSSIPFEIEAFRTRPRHGKRALWALLACLAAGVTAWVLLQPAPETPESPALLNVSAPQALPPGPPWLLGSPDARYTLTLYADLECPFCRSYVPTLTAWVEQHPETRLRWHHLPLPAHEPQASALASLAECAGASGGHTAFWQAVAWIYAHTRGNGQGMPTGTQLPGLEAATCLASGQPQAIVRDQAQGAARDGITATPTLRLHDERSGRALLLPGPVESDALLSALDLLAVGEAPAPASVPLPAR